MKKLKFLPTVLMLVLCVGVLAVGVFAITPTKNTISGTITINSSNPELTINLYKSEIDSEGKVAVAETKISGPHTVRAGITLDLEELVFTTDTANSLNDVNDIKIRIEVINNSEENLGMYFTKSANAEAETEIEPISLAGGVVVGTFSNYTALGGKATASALLTFSLESFPSSDVEIDLSEQGIYLNINEINNELIVKGDAYYEALGYTVVGQAGAELTCDDYVNAGYPKKMKIADGVLDFDFMPEDMGYQLGELEEVVIPGSVSVIREQRFWGALSLSKLTILEGVKKIECAALVVDGCDGPSGLTEIILPKSVENLVSSALLSYKLNYVYILPGTNLEYINLAAFAENTKIVFMAGTYENDINIVRYIESPEEEGMENVSTFEKGTYSEDFVLNINN